MSLEPSSVLPAMELPSVLPGSGNTLLYYVLCSLFFLFCGLICGFFIWRKGHMQTLDAEMEIQRTGEDLERMREDLSEEEKEIRSDEDSREIDEVLSRRPPNPDSESDSSSD